MRSIEQVFGNRSRVPEQLRAADGSLSAADEVAWLRRQAISDWLTRHGIFDVTVEQLAARIDEVGEDVATAGVLEAERRRAAAEVLEAARQRGD